MALGLRGSQDAGVWYRGLQRKRVSGSESGMKLKRTSVTSEVS